MSEDICFNHEGFKTLGIFWPQQRNMEATSRCSLPHHPGWSRKVWMFSSICQTSTIQKGSLKMCFKSNFYLEKTPGIFSDPLYSGCIKSKMLTTQTTKPTKQIHSLFPIFHQTHQSNPETPKPFARSFNLRPSSWSWIVKVSSIFAPGGATETANNGGKRQPSIHQRVGSHQLQGGWGSPLSLRKGCKGWESMMVFYVWL